MTGFNSKRSAAADKLQEPWNEDEWRRNNWRCQHGWLRGEQCEICNAPQREWVGLTEQEQGAIMEDLNAHGTRLYEFARAIEAKLKEKNL